MPLLTDTIAAISSPPGRSPRGLLRIAGPQAFNVTESLLTPNPGLRRSDLPPRTLTRATLKSPSLPVLLTLFPAPHSYTGDDLAEIQLPGHPALLDRVLHQTVTHGTRLAEPGEFTFRAFTAGKIDLTQAEGIAATIAAATDSQLRAAALLREGKLGSLSARLVDALGNALALVEAGIDFTDQEDVVPIGPANLDARLAALESDLAALLGRSRSWGALEALPRVVLVGPPSAGKSTLFNALLGRTRAVISPTPGTTRDALTEPLTLNVGPEKERSDDEGPGVLTASPALEILLTDIAGLDTPQALLDREAQAAAHRAIDAADLLLYVIDPTQPHAPPPPATQPILTVATKADLASTAAADLHVSAVTGEGLPALRAAIARALSNRDFQGASLSADMLALQPRHESTLRSALDHLRHARQLLAPHRAARHLPGVELIAGALRAALDDLAALGGHLTPDDVIGRVFATFCVGK